MNLYESCLFVAAMEKLARQLPPLDEVIDQLDAREFDHERRGLEIPRDALKGLRPVFLAARDFQKAIVANAALIKTESAAGSPGGGLKIDGIL